MTADDVIHTATTAKADKDNYIGTYPITAWLVTDTVEAVDANTVKFTLAAPNSVFLENLTDPAHSIMPKHLLDGQTGDALKASDFVTGASPIGSGPYKFVSLHARPVHRVRCESRLPPGSPVDRQDLLPAQGQPRHRGRAAPER